MKKNLSSISAIDFWYPDPGAFLDNCIRRTEENDFKDSIGLSYVLLMVIWDSKSSVITVLSVSNGFSHDAQPVFFPK